MSKNIKLLVNILLLSLLVPATSFAATFNNIHALPVYTPPAAYVESNGPFQACAKIPLKNPPANEGSVYAADCMAVMTSPRVFADSVLRNSTQLQLAHCLKNYAQTVKPQIASPYSAACVDALKVDGSSFWNKVQSLHDQAAQINSAPTSPQVTDGNLKDQSLPVPEGVAPAAAKPSDASANTSSSQ